MSPEDRDLIQVVREVREVRRPPTDLPSLGALTDTLIRLASENATLSAQATQAKQTLEVRNEELQRADAQIDSLKMELASCEHNHHEFVEEIRQLCDKE